MDYKYIEQLLDRYFEAETTLKEEQILKAFFEQSEEELPESLRQYKPLFAAMEQDETLGDDFDSTMDQAHYGLAGSPTHVKKSFTPPVKQGGIKIKEETGAESAAKLAKILADNGII